MKILINHVGYLSREAKRAVFQGSAADKPQGFALVGNNGSPVFSGGAGKAGEVANWKTGYYWVLDFSAFKGEGRFTIRVDLGGGTVVVSDEFEIRQNLLTMRLLSAAGLPLQPWPPRPGISTPAGILPKRNTSMRPGRYGSIWRPTTKSIPMTVNGI